MNRRNLLWGAAALAASGLSRRSTALSSQNRVRIAIDPGKTITNIGPEFMGLGYEISSVASGGPLSSGSKLYQQLIRTLGGRGVIRVGGNTSDYSTFSPAGQSVSASKASVINDANLKAFGEFLAATEWRLIWGLNLGNSNEENVVAEARAITSAAGKRLIAFEIGNEPDLFTHEGHRPQYSYDDYLREFRQYKQAIRRSLPQAKFAGPDVAGNLDWVRRFAADEGSDLKLLTSHYYREGQNPSSTLAKLLHPDPRLVPRLQEMQSAGESAHLPYRICETNSFSGGGRPGVSDTFGAALWALDFMFILASSGADGVNIETGINQLDRISSYSPLRGDLASGYSVGPDYYGMLAFAQATPGKMVAVDCDASGLELTAYAVIKEDGALTLSILNKEPAQDAEISIRAAGHATHARATWLKAPQLESRDGVTLGGATVNPDGTWRPASQPDVPVRIGECGLTVPAASAVVLTFAR